MFERTSNFEFDHLWNSDSACCISTAVFAFRITGSSFLLSFAGTDSVGLEHATRVDNMCSACQLQQVCSRTCHKVRTAVLSPALRLRPASLVQAWGAWRPAPWPNPSVVPRTCGGRSGRRHWRVSQCAARELGAASGSSEAPQRSQRAAIRALVRSLGRSGALGRHVVSGSVLVGGVLPVWYFGIRSCRAAPALVDARRGRSSGINRLGGIPVMYVVARFMANDSLLAYIRGASYPTRRSFS